MNAARAATARVFAAGLLGSVLLFSFGCSEAPDEPLVVSDARVRAPVPGQDQTAGYFTLENRSDGEIVLTRVESDAVRSIEMHTMTHEDGMMRMRPLGEVVVPAGETLRFEPGGRHLMLFGVADLGEQIDIVFHTHARAGDQARDGDGEPLRTTVRFRTIPMGDH